MNETAFHKFLLQNDIDKEQTLEFITRLRAFEAFLKNDGIDLDSLQQGKILEYTEFLVKNQSETVLDFLRALLQYANFSKQYDYVIEVIDIAEAYNAMDNFYQRVGEQYGEPVRDEIFEGIHLPPLGVNPETKPAVTKVVMQRLEAQLGVDKTIALLAPCLHGRPLEPSQRDRKDFLQLKDIDAFLALKHQEVVERVQRHQEEGTLEYAQYVDEDVVEYVKTTPTLNPGIRKGNRIISTKMPYQAKRYLAEEDERMKRYYYCYCPWVRGAIKKGEEQAISAHFCHCSAGFTKKYWDVIFDQPTTVEPIETVLQGSLVCKFAVQIPEEFQK